MNFSRFPKSVDVNMLTVVRNKTGAGHGIGTTAVHVKAVYRVGEPSRYTVKRAAAKAGHGPGHKASHVAAHKA